MSQDIKKQTILVVDDSTENLDILDSILSTEYNINFATNGKTAIEISKKYMPDIILLDIIMPVMDGFEACKLLKKDPLTKNIPIIFVTAKEEDFDEAKGFELGAVDYITKPVSSIVVKARVKTQLALYDQKRELTRLVNERTKELNQTRLEIIRKLGVASEFKDNETGIHVVRMSKYCCEIAKAYGFNEDEAELLLNAAPMHDLGKIGIPDVVLQKPGKLNDEEWEIIKTHCDIGKRIIGEHKSELISTAKIVAYEHHEKWNGKGYPQGLVGEDIHIYARIVAVADVFDALTSLRPYKEAWSTKRAIKLVEEEAGSHFDPKVVEAFIKAMPEIIMIKNKYQ